ncbi:hypothetical protein Tco_1235349 [Tanacetum coccineum]
MTSSNQASPQPYSPLLIDPYVDDILQGNHNNNQTQPQLLPSPTRERLVDEINQLQDLSNLLVMQLSNQTANPPPTPLNMPYTITLDQVEHHDLGMVKKGAAEVGLSKVVSFNGVGEISMVMVVVVGVVLVERWEGFGLFKDKGKCII